MVGGEDQSHQQLDVCVSFIWGQESLPPSIFFDNLSFAPDRFVGDGKLIQIFKAGSFCWATAQQAECEEVANRFVLLQVLQSPMWTSSLETESLDSQAKNSNKLSCGLSQSGALSLNILPGSKLTILLECIPKDEIPIAESVHLEVGLETRDPATRFPSNTPLIANQMETPAAVTPAAVSFLGERSTIRTARERLFGFPLSFGTVAVANFGGRRLTYTVRKVSVLHSQKSANKQGQTGMTFI